MATPVRISLFTTAALVLALLALCEIGMAYPVAWRIYLCVAIAFVIALKPLTPGRAHLVRIGVVFAFIGIMAALYFTTWNSRKPFLRDLSRVRVGMTEGEVRRIMSRYIEGTGWPASPFDTSTSAPGNLTIVGSGSKYPMTTAPSGEMAMRNSLVFRHSNDGAFNSDWGIVSLSSGRVVNVEFSPD